MVYLGSTTKQGFEPFASCLPEVFSRNDRDDTLVGPAGAMLIRAYPTFYIKTLIDKLHLADSRFPLARRGKDLPHVVGASPWGRLELTVEVVSRAQGASRLSPRRRQPLAW